MNFFTGVGGLGRGRVWRSQAWTANPNLQTKPYLGETVSHGYWDSLPIVQRQAMGSESVEPESLNDFSLSPVEMRTNPYNTAPVDRRSSQRGNSTTSNGHCPADGEEGKESLSDEIHMSISVLDQILDLFDDDGLDDQYLYSNQHQTPLQTTLASVAYESLAKTAERNLQVRKSTAGRQQIEALSVTEEDENEQQDDQMSISTDDANFTVRAPNAKELYERHRQLSISSGKGHALPPSTVSSSDSAVFLQSNELEPEPEPDYESVFPAPSMDDKSNPDSGYLATDQESIESEISGISSVKTSQPPSLRSNDWPDAVLQFGDVSSTNSDDDAAQRASDISTGGSTLTTTSKHTSPVTTETVDVETEYGNASDILMTAEQEQEECASTNDDVYDDICEAELPSSDPSARPTLHRQRSMSADWSAGRSLPAPSRVSQLSGSIDEDGTDLEAPASEEVPPHPGFLAPTSPFTLLSVPKPARLPPPPTPPKSWKSGSSGSPHDRRNSTPGNGFFAFNTSRTSRSSGQSSVSRASTSSTSSAPPPPPRSSISSPAVSSQSLSSSTNFSTCPSTSSSPSATGASPSSKVPPPPPPRTQFPLPPVDSELEPSEVDESPLPPPPPPPPLPPQLPNSHDLQFAAVPLTPEVPEVEEISGASSGDYESIEAAVGLAAALQAVQLRSVSTTESPAKPSHPQNDAVSALVSQLQSGVKLRSTQLGSRIRGQESEETVSAGGSGDQQTSDIPASGALDEAPVDNYVAPPPPSVAKSRNPPPAVPVKKPISDTSRRITASPSSNNVASLDATQLPGYQPIPADCPPWKRDMLERKNAKLLADAMKEEEAKKLEEERWKDVPEWKRGLLMKKQEDSSKETAAQGAAERKRYFVGKKAVVSN